MEIRFIVFDIASGEIESAGVTAPENLEHVDYPIVLNEADPNTQYIDTETMEVMDRPELPAIFPAGTYMKIFHEVQGLIVEETLEEDVEVEFEFPFFGSYRVHIIPPFPYIPQQYEYVRA